MGVSAQSTPKYTPPNYPKYDPYNIGQESNLATQYDTSQALQTQNFFNQQNPALAGAQKNWQQQIASDVAAGPQGFTYTPQLQNQEFDAGLSSGLQGLGGNVASLKPGTAQEANFARNFGLNQLGFQQANQQQLENSQNQINSEIGQATSMFPETQIGLGGADAVNSYLSNVAGQNNSNQGEYSANVQSGEYNTNIAAQNSALNLQAQQANLAAIMDVVKSIGQVAGAAAGACWVARAIYGDESEDWLYFRKWLFSYAPFWFFKLYMRHGERFAAWLKERPSVIAFVKPFFDSKVAIMKDAESEYCHG